MSRSRINVTIWSAARGGMRSVVEAYRADGFLSRHGVRLVASYVDGGFARRQLVLAGGLARYAGLLLRHDVGLVHIHAAMRGSFWRKGLFASIARLFGVPVLLHLHGSEMKPFWQSMPGWAQALARRHLERATGVIVLSESWRAFVASVAPAARIEVVPNYVAMPPLRDPAERPDDNILFLGLIGTRKGVWDLIPAFAEVHRRHPGARLSIAGNGEIGKARALADTHGLGGALDLPGWTEGDAKRALLDAAGIYVLPSHNEGLPMSVLEAMSHGLAVVTTRVGGIPELITDGVDGLLVDAGDVDALVAALDRLVSDPALRIRIARAGRARVAGHYSDAAVLPRLSALYERTARSQGAKVVLT